MNTLLTSLMFGILLQASAATPDAPNSFSLTIQATRRSVPVGTPVTVQVTVENISGSELSMTESSPEKTFIINVLDHDGKQPPRTAFGRVLKGEDRNTAFRYDRREILLKTDEKITRTVTLDTAYDLSAPGDYSVWVCKSIPKSGARMVCSNHVTITIVGGE